MNLFESISFVSIANFAVALSIVFAAILSVAYIIKGGIMAITAGGDAEKLKKGMHAIRYSIVGLVVVFLSVLIIKLVGAIVGIDLLGYVNKDSIVQMFTVIMERLNGNYTNTINSAPF